jgi:GDP-mannose transporter
MVLASCAVGIGISYFAFACRASLSATAFTVVGNACKILTVLLNVCVWDRHASAPGIAMLLLCLAMSTVYRQSPMRASLGDQHVPLSMDKA